MRVAVFSAKNYDQRTLHAANEASGGPLELVFFENSLSIDSVPLADGAEAVCVFDVYEEEAALFFSDRSDELLQDDVFARLLTFPNVLITGHQAFFTQEAFENIAETTLASLVAFHEGKPLGDCEVLLS